MGTSGETKPVVVIGVDVVAVGATGLAVVVVLRAATQHVVGQFRPQL